ncbi:hypothetical protein SPBR_00139 [Sporothrix brasiliensis 5110]|uniref:PWI domain-containing protein n=1 Tax=Sporothrix brasiliensis 5110 TaxID=1398154 RepID=A0A0C2FFE7_9PEZI|nr:uncharacterized protein SPBR_00139 [Sporothrix brasiliensis 5110]KIH89853.1 hypothetical protein SPBR_00139 [Sporothrix brasiliensis 5110]
MAYNPYGGPYGQPPPNYNPYPGANQGPGMGYPPPGMSPAAAANAPPGMAPPPGVHHQPPSAPQANRPPSGPHGYGGVGAGPGAGGGRGPPGGYGGPPGHYAPSFQPPPSLPGNINFNAPVIRLGGANGPPPGPGASSLPARPNIPPGPSGYNNGMPTGPGGGGGRRVGEPDTPLSAHSHSGSGTPLRPDFRQDRFGGGGGDRFERGDRGDRGDRFDRYGGDRNDRYGGDRDRDRDRDRDNRGERGDRDRNGGLEQARAAIRDTMHSQAPPTNDEKLRTIFVHKVPAAGVGGEAGLQQLLGLAGRLRRFDAGTSHLTDSKDSLFAFAQYEDANALASALALLKDVYVPVERQVNKEQDGNENKDEETKDSGDQEKEDKKGHKDETDDTEEKEEKNEGDDGPDDTDDPFRGIKKVRLQVAVDPVSLKYIESFQEKQSDEAKAEAKSKQDALRPAFEKAVHSLFFPPKIDPATAAAAAAAATAGGANGNGDVMMTDINGIPLLTGSGLDGLEGLNIPLGAAAAAAAAAADATQEDELADVPAEMREMVAAEIASFREQSTRRDLERLKREQEMEELERRRNGEDAAVPSRQGRLESPGPTNSVPLGPRSGGGGGGGVHPSRAGFVNGGRENGDDRRDRRDRRDRDRDRDSDPDTEASDDELYRREQRKIQAEDERLYSEAERKWATRERQRAAALERERERERTEKDNEARFRADALARDAAWDDEREASRKTVLYYRDHAAWLRKRANDRATEEARDAADRRAEQDEARKQAAAMEAVRSQADSFLDGMGIHGEGHGEGADAAKHEAQAAEQQKVTISFGAAAQRNQAQRGAATRRTVAEVEGLLDDGEHEGATKRQLVPIKFEPMAASARMSDEEINEAVRQLVQEIPTTQEGLWAWPVEWACMDDAVVRDKLRPFVEKKVVEYLGVQEQFLVEVVEEHLRKHGTPQALVEELQEALDEAAEDLVKKLWRMVIFFTESEKRGLPA